MTKTPTTESLRHLRIVVATLRTEVENHLIQVAQTLRIIEATMDTFDKVPKPRKKPRK